MAGAPGHRAAHCRAASSIGSNGGRVISVDDPGPAQAGALHHALDGEVPLVGPGDVADVAQSLLLGGGLEDEVAEAQDPAVQRLDHRDVEDPVQRHRGEPLGQHPVDPEDAHVRDHEAVLALAGGAPRGVREERQRQHERHRRDLGGHHRGGAEEEDRGRALQQRQRVGHPVVVDDVHDDLALVAQEVPADVRIGRPGPPHRGATLSSARR
jgi:hypothetical protein